MLEAGVRSGDAQTLACASTWHPPPPMLSRSLRIMVDILQSAREGLWWLSVLGMQQGAHFPGPQRLCAVSPADHAS